MNHIEMESVRSEIFKLADYINLICADFDTIEDYHTVDIVSVNLDWLHTAIEVLSEFDNLLNGLQSELLNDAIYIPRSAYRIFKEFLRLLHLYAYHITR